MLANRGVENHREREDQSTRKSLCDNVLLNATALRQDDCPTASHRRSPVSKLTLPPAASILPAYRTVHGAPDGKFSMPEGYCVKCKAKKEIADGVEETMKNGRKAIKGKCPTCGTVMFKILGGKAAPPTPPPAAA